MRTKPRSPAVAVSAAPALPAFETAARELARREARAFAWMLVRLVCTAVLIALFLRAAPALSPFRPLFDAGAGVLVLAPLFTSLGRVFAWRIALAQSYLSATRFADADTALRPLSGIRATLFDARGEGRYCRAHALLGLNRADDALLLLREVSERGRAPWDEKARAELAARHSERDTIRLL